MKTVRLDIDEDRRVVARQDAACELKLLSALCHPNIIRVWGVMGGISRPEGFGIIMDRLSATMREKIDHWSSIPFARSHRRRQLSWPWLRSEETRQSNTDWDDLFMERIMAVYDTAKGMKYLHEKKIVFRDLKPNNVGVTLQGDYVIFDLGLAKELRWSDLLESPDGYEATGLIGSRMFMAPEVATCKAYGFSADVFSFAMLFWEVFALKEPYPHLSLSKHYEIVILGGTRPPALAYLLPPSLEGMMEASWSDDPSKRPTFESICAMLHEEITKHAGSGLKDMKDIDVRSEILPLKSPESPGRMDVEQIG